MAHLGWQYHEIKIKRKIEFSWEHSASQAHLVTNPYTGLDKCPEAARSGNTTDHGRGTKGVMPNMWYNAL